jgi:hypothetical protein
VVGVLSLEADGHGIETIRVAISLLLATVNIFTHRVTVFDYVMPIER